MEEREKLKLILANNGDCKTGNFECGDCPVNLGTGMCTELGALDRAKKRLFDTFLFEEKTSSKVSEKQMNLRAKRIPTTFSRNDQVLADGKQWRVDWLDGPYLGLSAVDGSHKELHKNVCEKISNNDDLVDDVLSRVTMP